MGEIENSEKEDPSLLGLSPMWCLSLAKLCKHHESQLLQLENKSYSYPA